MAFGIENPSPQTAVAPRDTAPPSSTVLPLPPEGYGSFDWWTTTIKADESKRDDNYKPLWDRNVQSYLARARNQLNSAFDTDTITVPKDFANVEQKKAQLFFQLPKIVCRALQPRWEAVTMLAQAILRFYLGPARINAMRVMHECLFDALCPSGLLCSKIGYEATQDGIVPMMVPNPQAAPTPQPGSILGLGPTSPAMMAIDVPRIISEKYFWERLSPAKVIIPSDWHGSDYDKAPYLGHLFKMPTAIAMRVFGLSEDDLKSSTASDEHRIQSERTSESYAPTDEVTGRELFYQAHLFDPNEKHPERFRQLVLIDGLDRPAVHRDSPYQKFDPKTGRLVMGMRGNPIHIGALRYVSDSAYPPSECTIGRGLVDELGKFRTQMVLLRDRAVSTIAFDENRLGAANAEKIRKGILGAWIGVPSLDGSNPLSQELAKAHTNQDNYRGNDYIDRDLSEVWAFGPNQRGEEAMESRTATEMQIAQQNSSARIAAERGLSTLYFVRGAMKVWSLLQMFADNQEWIEVIGADGVAQMQQWNKQSIAGEYIFEADPDSAAQVDITQKRNDDIKLYEMVARDPNTNRVPILRELMADFGFDPQQSVVTQLPAKGPEPASVSFSMKLEDLSLQDPLFQLKVSLLQQSGYTIPPEVIQAAQAHAATAASLMAHAGLPPDAATVTSAMQGMKTPINGGSAMAGVSTGHPGTALKAERLNKHTERHTGGIPNAPGLQ